MKISYAILSHLARLFSRYALLNLNDEPKNDSDYRQILSAASASGARRIHPGSWLMPGTRVFITGSGIKPQQLVKTCKNLRKKNCLPIIVTDAIDNIQELHPTLHELNETQLAQISPSVPLICLLRGIGSEFVYAFPKVDVTTTMAVLFEGGDKVLLMVRDREPFKDFYSLPGGFLDSMLETLRECAVRELHEEVFKKASRRLLSPEELVLVDVRSEPKRDRRGHVVDHGYLWMVPAEREAEVLASIEAGDDAKEGSAKVISVQEALSTGLAFDHAEFLRAALERINKDQRLAQSEARFKQC